MQIQCNHISKNYQSFQALKDVNFHVDSGAFFAMTGANGAGKSTLLDILIKRIPANQGTVLINHQDISKTDANYFRDIRIVFQEYVTKPRPVFLDWLVLRDFVRVYLYRFPERICSIFADLCVLFALYQHSILDCSCLLSNRLSTALVYSYFLHLFL
ncbi:ATP-binding cassette domain-containing protein [Listeria riparia]|uniref:Multidrug ABC transporter ATPase n=1 Tax=Listeria riparia FSL S10-1204 TaxID=1265816 RepID=W7DCT3_9LIST|nr:ATP-binding cassette domain-containing protein [Listeria riparia]EUJ45296.1 multidrug ABC transporter ATPase [Listeria riparia FSL S10-1204]